MIRDTGTATVSTVLCLATNEPTIPPNRPIHPGRSNAPVMDTCGTVAHRPRFSPSRPAFVLSLLVESARQGPTRAA